VAVDGADWESWHKLALALRALGRVDESARAQKESDRLRKAMNQERVALLLRDVLPALPNVAGFMTLGEFCEDAGQTTEALGWFQLAQGAAPENKRAQEAAERLAARKTGLEAVDAVLSRSAEKATSSPGGRSGS
jgi:hypothetical protein